MAADFPNATFLELGPIETVRPKTTAAGQHELYDRRRAAGLAAARGELVAILEDRGIPRHDWAATVARLHRELPNRVIGGAIEGAPTGLLNWAFYVCDFGRYGLPFEQHTAEWVSDVNVSYKRSAVEETRHLWCERFRDARNMHCAPLSELDAPIFSVAHYGIVGDVKKVIPMLVQTLKERR